jgi:hypothetical protein
MNNTKLSLLSIVAIAAFLIAAATFVPGNYAMAHKHKNKHRFVSIGNSESNVVQFADNSQKVATGAGSDNNNFVNAPTNVQEQEVNTGGAVVR